jgi:hypothetical protein
VYNTIIEAIIHELVNDGIVVKRQKEFTPDDPVDKYEATQKLDKICKDFKDAGLPKIDKTENYNIYRIGKLAATKEGEKDIR